MALWLRSWRSLRPPSGGVDELEPCGSDFNFGCIGSCPVFNTGFAHLLCGQTGCGDVWAENGDTDEDWWRFHIQDDGTNTGEVQVCITVETEFPAIIELYSGHVCDPTLIAQFETDACGTETHCDCLPVIGNWFFSSYWLRIRPAINDGLPCSADGNYTIDLACQQPCENVEYEFGACCKPQLGGPCVQATESYCENSLNGIWQGAGTPCWPDPCPAYGACCHRFSEDSDYFPCIETWEDDCLNNFLDPTFHGDGVPCSDVQCPGSPCGEGAGHCFLPNGTPGCEHKDCCAAVCDLLPHCCGDGWDQQCADWAPEICFGMDILPPLGACCHVIPGTEDVDCVERTEEDCLNTPDMFENPTWHGGETCDDVFDDCFESYWGIGACCFIDADGDEQCMQTSEVNCTENLGGDFMPGGACQPDPCPIVVEGACCYEDPELGWTCAELTEDECEDFEGSAFHPWQSCTPNPCPQSSVGACCWIDDEGSQQCAQLTPDDCEADDGTFIGLGIPCDPNPCEEPEPTSACCVETDSCDNQCIVTTQNECEDALGGMYQGDDESCSSGLCACPSPDCPEDVNCDGVVDVFDLLIVIGSWGQCPQPCPELCCPADINDDCVVDVFDLLAVIGAWGVCP